VAYGCTGGRFVDSLYWRQSVPRYTGRLSMNLHQRGGGQLVNCTAAEEHPDGTENSVTDGLTWDYDGDDIIVMLTCNYLRPGQSVTLRWEIDRERA
jgi:hypothetical protein